MEHNANEEILKEETEEGKQSIPDWQKRLERMMEEAYLKGLATGMKTMCGVVIDKISTGQKSKNNPTLIILDLLRFANSGLDMHDEGKEESEQDERGKVINISDRM